MDYLVVYLEIITLCVVMAVSIYINASRDLGSDREMIVFRWIVRVIIIALIMDGFTQAQYRGYIHFPRWIIGFFYSSYMFFFSGVLSYLWLLFAELRIGTSVRKHKIWFILAMIPPIIVGIMSYASMRTGWFYSLDENGIYTRGPYWGMQSALAYVYFFITTVHALIAASKAKSITKRKELLILSTFIIAPTIGALLQLVVGGHPFVGPATCISILFIFMNIQGSMVYNDSLTSLNNRKRVDQYLEEMIERANYNPFYLYLLDIDKFKAINDTQGHVEGDHALRVFGEVLRRSTDKYRGFVGRYGGDEFVSIILVEDIENPDDYIDEVHHVLKQISEEENLKYEMKVTLGYTKCEYSEITPPELIANADKMLYKNKTLD